MESSGWDVRARSTDLESVSVHARLHTFRVGAPIHFDTEYGEITALEYVLGAVAADLIGTFRKLAHRQRIDVDQVEALVHGELDNPLMHMGVIGETGHPGLSRMAVKCYVSSLADEEPVRRVWQLALERSPLTRTFTNAGMLEIEMQIVI